MNNTQQVPQAQEVSTETLWQKVRGKSGFFLTTVSLIALGITNPSQEAYLKYAVWKIKNTTCQQQPLSPSLQMTCTLLSPLPYPLNASILRGYSHRDNYILFSIYTIDFLGLEHRSIGIAGHFF